MKSKGFPPVIGVRPTVLVLGSLPGQASLDAGQYYAQPRNAFWFIMGALCAAGPERDYDDRLEAVKRAGIAIWDVYHEAARPGSLDSNIVKGSERVNDICGLIARNDTLKVVAFNGRKSEAEFRRSIEPGLPTGRLTLLPLPSTSPAYASLRREQKLAIWQRALKPHLRAG